MKSSLLNKKAAEPGELPGYGQTDKPANETDAANMLGIPLINIGEAIPLLGDNAGMTAKIALVGMGANSTDGLLGAPFHFAGQAFCVGVVVEMYDQPILVIDVTQNDLEHITSLVGPLVAQAEQLMNKAEEIGMGR